MLTRATIIGCASVPAYYLLLVFIIRVSPVARKPIASSLLVDDDDYGRWLDRKKITLALWPTAYPFACSIFVCPSNSLDNRLMAVKERQEER